MGVMGARRFRLTIVACLCGLACALAAGVVPGVAGAAQLGATQIGSTESQGVPGEGESAGQLVRPAGVAVDSDPSSLFSGDVYVVDRVNNRIDRFSGSGAFQLAWGWGVADGANQLQTCTTSCQRGKQEEDPPYNTGGVSYALGVAVDNDLLSSSAGDVYVVQAATSRVEKFGPSGEFLLMFGGDVNETTGGNVCLVGEKCEAGTAGTGNGQFTELGEGNNIAVGPGGLVYVGDRARVQVFEPSGVWKESISLAGLASTGDVKALAVDSSGDMFLYYGPNETVQGGEGGAPGVHEFEPDGMEKGTVFDAGSTSVTSIAVDGSGDLFVGDSSGGSNFGFHVLKYTPTGKAVASFGSNTVRGGETEVLEHETVQNHPFGYNGMAFSEAPGSGELYVSESYYSIAEHTNEQSTSYSSVWVLPVPSPGPLVAGESAKPGPSGSASLEATVNPDNNETTYYFEYVSEADFKASGYSDAARTPVGSIPASLEDRSVSAHITGLPVSSGYHYRVVASNSESIGGPAIGPDQTFETLPALYLEALYTTNVASTSATFGANLNPLGSSTEYRFEYGTSTSYGHTVTGSAGEGVSSVLVSSHLQELSASTTYHYRIVAVNGLGAVEGSDHTFTTQSTGGEPRLPDGRAWELVSPPNKKGALIEQFSDGGNEIQAASNGSGIAYLSQGPAVGGDQQGKTTWSQVLSRHDSGAWSSEDLTLPGRLSETKPASVVAVHAEYRLFSSDLSLAAVEPQESNTPLLSPDATENTLYLRDDSNRIFAPLVTAANVPTETKFGGGEVPGQQMYFATATPDLSHVVLSSQFALTPEATDLAEVVDGGSNFYEWSAGRLQLVNVLPNGETAHGGPVSAEVRLGNGGSPGLSAPAWVIPSVVSSDGRRIAWSWGRPYREGDPNATTEGTQYRGLYVRDMVEEKTVQIGGPLARILHEAV